MEIFKFKKEQDFINDRRKSKRYDIMLRLKYLSPETGVFEESITKDISRSGLRFSSSHRLPKGSLLHIDIEDPNSNKTLSLKGIVEWAEEFLGKDDSSSVRYETGVSLVKKLF